MTFVSSMRFSLAALVALVFTASFSHAQAPDRTIWDGVYSEAQAERGRANYVKVCQVCHGANFLGHLASNAPALKGASFIGDWESESLGAVFEKIRTTMPPQGAGLVANEKLDVLAFIL